MTAIRATVNPPTPGTMCAKNDPIPVTRLTTASVLVRVAAGGEEAPAGPIGPEGPEVVGATCWPAIWVGVAAGCEARSPGDVLTSVSLRRWSRARHHPRVG